MMSGSAGSQEKRLGNNPLVEILVSTSSSFSTVNSHFHCFKLIKFVNFKLDAHHLQFTELLTLIVPELCDLLGPPNFLCGFSRSRLSPVTVQLELSAFGPGDVLGIDYNL